MPSFLSRPIYVEYPENYLVFYAIQCLDECCALVLRCEAHSDFVIIKHLMYFRVHRTGQAKASAYNPKPRHSLRSVERLWAGRPTRGCAGIAPRWSRRVRGFGLDCRSRGSAMSAPRGALPFLIKSGELGDTRIEVRAQAVRLIKA